MDGIRVNMSAKEGNSVTLDPLPSGKYRMAITDIDLEKVQNPPTKPGKKDNRGEPMFVIELTVQDGDYENRKAWTNVMLFAGALYSASQMLKAQGIEVKELADGSAEFQVPGFEKNTIPGTEWWMSKQFVCKLQLGSRRKVGDKEYEPRAEVKGFMSAKDWDPKLSPKKQDATTVAKAKSSMLP